MADNSEITAVIPVEADVESALRTLEKLIAAADTLQGKFEQVGSTPIVNAEAEGKALNKLMSELDKTVRTAQKLFKTQLFTPEMGPLKEALDRVMSSAASGAAEMRKEFALMLSEARSVQAEFEKAKASGFTTLKNYRDAQWAEKDNTARMVVLQEKEQLARERAALEEARKSSRLSSTLSGQSLISQNKDEVATARMSQAFQAEEMRGFGRSFQMMLAQRRDDERAAEQLEAQKVREQAAQNRVRAREESQASLGERRYQQRAALMDYRGGAGALMLTGAFAFEASALFGTINALHSMWSATTELEKSLTNIRAITGSTDGEMKTFRETVMGVSNATKFSSADLAEGAAMMTKVGMSADQVSSSLKAIAQYAQASGATIHEAFDSVTHLQMVFGMRPDQTTQVTDLLTNAANKTKLGPEQLGVALQYVSQEAADANVSLNEMTLAMTMAAQSGIRSGSMLGTGFRKLIQELIDPTTKFKKELDALGISMSDVDVKTNGLLPTLQGLVEKGFSSESAMRAFDTRSAHIFAAITRALPDMNHLNDVLGRQGSTAEAASLQTQSLSFQFDRLGNVLGNIGDQAFKPVQDSLASILGTISDGITTVSKFGDAIGVLGTALSALATVLVGKKLLELIKGLAAFMVEDVAAAGGLAAFLSGPATLAVVGITAALTGLILVLEHTKDAYKEAEDAAKTYADQKQKEADANQTAIRQIDAAIEQLTRHGSGGLKDYDSVAAGLSKQFGALGLSLDGADRSAQGLIQSLMKLRDLEQGNQASNTTGSEVGLQRQLKALKDDEARLKQNQALSTLGQFDEAGNPIYAPDTSAESAKKLKENQDKQAQVQRDIDYARAQSMAQLPTADEKRNQQTLVGLRLGWADATKGFGNLSDREKIDRIKSFMSGKAASDAQSMAAQLGPEDQLSTGVADVLGEARSQLSTLQETVDKETTRMVSARVKALGNAFTRLTSELRGIKDDVKDTTTLDSVKALDAKIELVTAERRRNLLEQQKLEIDKVVAAGNARKDKASGEEISSEIDSVNLGFSEKLKQVEDDAVQLHRNITDALFRRWDAEHKLMTQANQSILKAAEDHASELKMEGQGPLDAAKFAQSSLKAQFKSDPTAAFKFDALQHQIDGPLAKQAIDKQLQGAQGILVALQGELKTLDEELNKTKSEFNDLLSRPDVSAAQRDAAQTRLNDLSNRELDIKKKIADEESKIADLTAKRGDLEDKAVPQTAGQALTGGFNDWVQKSGLGSTPLEKLRSDVPMVLNSVSNGFAQFTSNILTRTGTVKQAFMGMVQGIIQSLMQLATNQFAMRMFGMLLGSLGTPGGGGAGLGTGAGLQGAAGSGQGVPSNFLGGAFAQGGFIHHHAFHRTPLRAAQGYNPTPTRDSVPILAQPGEAILNQSAVQLIGGNTISDMNSWGNRVRSSSAPTASSSASKEGSNNNVHVWVVAPGQKPQLGPKDVLATISDDILRGGQTRQLIKSVAMGA